ncbi:MAG: DUF885 domain-containing protein [Actinomycetota bacterium]|nr:DUF885 domain-containing protein [Actinomycetota bacterium]
MDAAGPQPLFSDVVDDLLRLYPERATALGDHRSDDRLDDLTPDGVAARARVLARRRDELDSLDVDALPPDDAVDLEVLRNGLDRRLFATEVLAEHTWNPLLHLPGEALHPLLARDVLPAADRLRALAARMSAVPDRLAAAERTLEDLPAVHAETAAQQARGAVRLVREGVGELLQSEPSLRPEVEPAQDAAASALERYAAWLERQPATRDPRRGAEVYAAELHLVLDAELSSQQVVHAAREHLDAVTEELERVARDWVGPVDDPVRVALDRVAADAPDDSTVVALARQALAETTEVVRRTGLATVPDDPCEVQVMPEFRRGVAVAYCDAPGALERGGTTLFAISPTPADWPPERVASFYREYNTALVTELTVHEAMPGHVLQLAHARRHPSLVRQVLSSGTLIEGWAVHAERLMVEQGHGGVPVRLQQLKMQLRMTLNALLDAGVHAGGLQEAEALELLTRRGYQEEGEAVGKWRRALLTSAQLSTYFVGYSELTPLLRGRSSFDEVLAHGSPPPRHLRTLLGD